MAESSTPPLPTIPIIPLQVLLQLVAENNIVMTDIINKLGVHERFDIAWKHVNYGKAQTHCCTIAFQQGCSAAVLFAHGKAWRVGGSNHAHRACPAAAVQPPLLVKSQRPAVLLISPRRQDLGVSAQQAVISLLLRQNFRSSPVLVFYELTRFAGKIWEFLRSELEMDGRFKTLESKLNLIQDNLKVSVFNH